MKGKEMSNRVERFKRRHVRRCIKLFLGTLILCTAFNVVADYQLHKDLEQVKYQQQDTLNMIMEHRQVAEPAETKVESEVGLVSLGEFEITHYCPCTKCCGKTDRVTYSGTVASEGRTIGVDPEVIALGSTVWINGHAYIAEDTGAGIKGNKIDVFVESHEDALVRGRYKAEVFI